MTFVDTVQKGVDRFGSAAVAKKCGVTQRTVQRWARGKENPNASTVLGAMMYIGYMHAEADAKAKKGSK